MVLHISKEHIDITSDRITSRVLHSWSMSHLAKGFIYAWLSSMACMTSSYHIHSISLSMYYELRKMCVYVSFLTLLLPWCHLPSHVYILLVFCLRLFLSLSPSLSWLGSFIFSPSRYLSYRLHYIYNHISFWSFPIPLFSGRSLRSSSSHPLNSLYLLEFTH